MLLSTTLSRSALVSALAIDVACQLTKVIRPALAWAARLLTAFLGPALASIVVIVAVPTVVASRQSTEVIRPILASAARLLTVVVGPTLVSAVRVLLAIMRSTIVTIITAPRLSTEVAQYTLVAAARFLAAPYMVHAHLGGPLIS